MAVIATHKELADFIAGRSVLHLNSLGKDSAVCLDWLANYASPSRIVSVFFKRIASHPDDDRYLKYQMKRYPNVEFLVEPNGGELGGFPRGTYQSPLEVINEFNSWEYIQFSYSKQAQDLCKKFGLEFTCIGHAKYESVSRAIFFNKNGLVDGSKIFPIGLMQKKDVQNIIRERNIKLHPCYKVAQSTFDYPSYYKMRNAFIVRPEYKKTMYSVYPLMLLDEYRYERLFK